MANRRAQAALLHQASQVVLGGGQTVSYSHQTGPTFSEGKRVGLTTGSGDCYQLAVEQNEPTQPSGAEGLSLIRAIGRWGLTAVGVNQVIGSGIFVMPAAVAAAVGTASSPLPWVAAGIANALIILCFAEAGGRFRAAGGPYLYARTAFGPLVGFEVAWMMWVTRVVSQAALANAFALYVGRFWAGATEGGGRFLVVTAVIGILATINLLGVRYGSLAINFFTLSKLVPLLLFILMGLFFIQPENFEGMFDLSQGQEGFGAAVLMLMFAFGGYELISIPAGEVRSPRRDTPFALLLMIAIVFVVYFLVQLVAAGTLAGLESSQTPLADAAAVFMGPAGGVLVAIGGLIAIAGSNAGSMLAGPRITFALGEKAQPAGPLRPCAPPLPHPRLVNPGLCRYRPDAVFLGYVCPAGNAECRGADRLLHGHLRRSPNTTASPPGACRLPTAGRLAVPGLGADGEPGDFGRRQLDRPASGRTCSGRGRCSLLPHPIYRFQAMIAWHYPYKARQPGNLRERAWTLAPKTGSAPSEFPAAARPGCHV